jgi:hypothetical protein
MVPVPFSIESGTSACVAKGPHRVPVPPAFATLTVADLIPL